MSLGLLAEVIVGHNLDQRPSALFSFDEVTQEFADPLEECLAYSEVPDHRSGFTLPLSSFWVWSISGSHGASFPLSVVRVVDFVQLFVFHLGDPLGGGTPHSSTMLLTSNSKVLSAPNSKVRVCVLMRGYV